MNHPNYNKIYLDLIDKKFPEKKEELIPLLAEEIKNSLELIKFNNLIFTYQKKDILAFNQKLRSYDETSIKKIMEYQKTNQLNNQQMANQFRISRNTIAKWKKLFV
ncbi:helix-turn-helix domain-containing protein [Chryseobacterium sp. RP-3-3]|uniref:Helix-turn-helix domain-containing protein n=1 Tax=Chryseobacterium antibioticum TaxID=2728847 RepID=A0A7Y0FPN9_9FLAO|nr:helix-turn-helix domain-containing protein [Chryseobacterium antibioticum]NML68277.1 helix-turn-helix domain-containing protein [Chryseobacterium antibioticum]